MDHYSDNPRPLAFIINTFALREPALRDFYAAALKSFCRDYELCSSYVENLAVDEEGSIQLPPGFENARLVACDLGDPAATGDEEGEYPNEDAVSRKSQQYTEPYRPAEPQKSATAAKRPGNKAGKTPKKPKNASSQKSSGAVPIMTTGNDIEKGASSSLRLDPSTGEADASFTDFTQNLCLRAHSTGGRFPVSYVQLGYRPAALARFEGTEGIFHTCYTLIRAGEFPAEFLPNPAILRCLQLSLLEPEPTAPLGTGKNHFRTKSYEYTYLDDSEGDRDGSGEGEGHPHRSRGSPGFFPAGSFHAEEKVTEISSGKVCYRGTLIGTPYITISL